MNNIFNVPKLFREETIGVQRVNHSAELWKLKAVISPPAFFATNIKFFIKKFHSKKGVKNIAINYLLRSKQIKLHFLYRKQLSSQ